VCRRQTEVAGAGRESVVHREGAEGRVATRAPPGDQEPIPIDLTLRCQPSRGVDAVGRVDDAPVAVQSLPVSTPEARAPPVVHVHQREATARPELVLEGEARHRLGRRPTVALHDERRPFVGRPGRVSVPGRIEVRERGRAALGRELDLARDREEGLVDLDRR
jgi:hypothetical protein